MAAAATAARLGRLSTSSTAFFLCDIQEKFRNLIYEFPHVIATAQKLTDASRVLGVPLIVTEQHPKGLGHTVTEIDISNAALRLPKTKFSMCIPEVEQYLQQSNIKSVVLFGIETHVCVSQTALDLLKADIDVYVMADGVSSMNRAEIPLALKRLEKEGAVITSSDTVLFQILRDAGHPKFKETSQLVKTHAKHTSDNSLFQFVASRL
ncbi:hypothetical protein RI367_005082 [Sorochytrium milnesiophthora]